ncbi:hypothetical protein [Synechococcus sp. UW140]|uniref:hypothetical protein n=1 Tax=Synechococcus sp. UW140 TaxID=368503 RepID=UPI0010BE0F63|nr:hypothetical protein [Synechococcus sp. UW140]
MEDELYLVCPCCSCDLTVDAAGELIALETPQLEPNESHGIGGLRVEHSGVTPNEIKLQNQQHHKRRESLTDVPILGSNPKAIEFEQSILDANNADLSRRAIRPRTKSKQ